MSLRIMVVGPECSGKSTVAGQLALLLQKVTRRPAKPVAVLTTPTMVYRRMAIKVRPARSASAFLAALQAAPSGSVMVADELSDLYADILVGSYEDAARAARAAAGLPDQGGALGPYDFRLIRSRYDSLFRSARNLDLDLIEVYRMGPGEGGEMKVRGASGTGRGSDLILTLEGGLASSRTDRRVRVFADSSFTASKESRELPRISQPGDLKKLASLLRDLVAPSLEVLASQSREEAALWECSPEGPEQDFWPEVMEFAQRSEAEQIVSQVRAVCEIYAIAGRRRTLLLYEHFKVGDMEALLGVRVLTLRTNFERFAAAAAFEAERESQAEWIRTQVRQKLDLHGLGGTSNEARQGRAKRLGEAFGTDLDGLEQLDLLALKEGFVAFLAGLPSAEGAP